MASVANTFQTADENFALGILEQLKFLRSPGQVQFIDRINFGLSIIRGIEPRDPTEAILASQMAAVHSAIMSCTRRMFATDMATGQVSDADMAAFNKLTRTFAVQMDTLKRWRSTGEQNIRVQHQHVTVNDGGKAIVGPVHAGVRAPQGKESQPHGSSRTHEQGAALLSDVETLGIALSLPSGQGMESLPDTRGEIGSTEGPSEWALPDGPSHQGGHPAATDGRAPAQRGSRDDGGSRKEIGPASPTGRRPTRRKGT
jgi:hypothetical protein